RESEMHAQSIAGGAYQGTAGRIAQAVIRDQADYEWFTDSAPLAKTCPISTNDLRRVLAALRQFTPEKRRELDLAWPETVSSSERFAELVSDEKNAIAEEQKAVHEADEQLADQLA